MQVRGDRTFRFEQPPDVVWEAIGRVDAYRDWWPWLRGFEARGLVAGERWECAVRPPLPYVLRFAVTLDEVQPHRRIAATVTGDLTGEAHLALAPNGTGCDLRLTSTLVPTGRPLRQVMALAPWLGRFGHDWVLDTGVRQFRRHAL